MSYSDEFNKDAKLHNHVKVMDFARERVVLKKELRKNGVTFNHEKYIPYDELKKRLEELT